MNNPIAALSGSLLFGLLLAALPATAQVTPDGTTSTTVDANGNNFEINDGDRAGDNLFHSFDDFSVPNGGEAFFNNAADIVNIFSRVTGGSISDINGLIRANGSANLFLVNIELGGLTETGTINFNDDGSLGFPEGIARGNVSLTQGSIINVTSDGGGFVAVNADNLDILDGSAIIAGIDAEVGTPESQAGDITLNTNGKITIQGTADINAGGISSLVNTNGIGNAGNIIIDTTTLEGVGNFAIISATFGQGNAGKVTVTARESISLEGLEGFGSGIGSAVAELAIGNGNDITINTPSLSLSTSSQLATSTIGQGNAGNIQVNATDSISLSSGSVLQAATLGEESAGNITINAGSFSLSDGASLNSSTSGMGNSGRIEITTQGATELAGGNIFNNVEAGGVGDSLGISITAQSLSVSDGAQIQTLVRGVTEENSGFGQGNAGDITINATEAVTFTGVGENGFPSAVFSDLGTGATGSAGDIIINASSLSLTDGASLNSSTSGMGNSGRIQITTEGATELSGLSTSIFNNVEAGGVGDSLGISITAQSLSVSDGAQIQTLVRGVNEENPGFGQGNAGDITINVTETVTFTGVGEDSNGRVFSSAAFSNLEAGATGSAGDIIINASSLSLTDGADLDSSTSGTGNSGRIEIITQGATELAGGDIFNNVEAGGVGDSLGISITAQSLSVSDGTQIQTLVRGTTDHNAVSSNVCVTLSRSMFLKASKTNPKKLVAHGVTFPVYTFFPA